MPESTPKKSPNQDNVANGDKELTGLLNVDKAEEAATEEAGNLRQKKDGLVDPDDFEPSDGGWGWVVCVASFWTNGTIFGILNLFGVLLVSIIDEFKDKEGENIAFKVSWIGALQIALTFFLSPIVSIFVDRVGIRLTAFVGAIIATLGMIASSFVNSIELLYLTYGVCLGAGSSFVYTPSMVILGHYFKKRLGIVNGIVSFGSAVFTFVLPYVMQYTLDTWGMRWTMRLLACLEGVLILCALSWKPQFNSRHKELDHYLSQESVAQKVKGCGSFFEKFLNFDNWKNPAYRIWVTGVPVCFFGYFVPFVHLVKHVNDVLPQSNPMILVMCLGATSGVSRLVCGQVADLPQVNRVRMQQFAFFIIGVCTACIPLAKHFWILVIIVLIMGICDGCFVCLIGPIAFDILGPAGAGQGIGCLLGLMSIPMTIGPPVAGFLYDYMGSYTIAFYAAGAPPIIGACILFLMPYNEQVVPQVNMAESLAAMSHENLDKVHGSQADLAFSYEGRRIVSMRNIPIAVSTDHLPPHMSPHVRRRLPHIHRPSYLNEDLSGSTPNLMGPAKKLRQSDKQQSTFSSIPMLNKV